jgi:hypothetical protein
MRVLFHVSAGVGVPVFLLFTTTESHTVFSVMGVYLIVLVVQGHINVVLFDDFRARDLPPPGKPTSFIKSLDKYLQCFIPIDPKLGVKENVIRSGRRRVLLALMDYWLLMVGFSLVYWSAIPGKFRWDKGTCTNLNDYVDALYFSVTAATTLGFGDITPTHDLSKILAVLEAILGFLFAVLIIAYAVRLLPDPRRLFP